jgi:ribosomal protein S18 acetylase RimI-like enzyme
MNPPFRLETLSGDHDRAGFSCGHETLDRYFRTQVTQDIRRRVAACFVAVEAGSGQVAAYYTLAAAGIPFTELPEGVAKKLPRYPSIPAVRIGRLAVDGRYQGRGLGGALLADALMRAMASPAAAYALLVDAKDEMAVEFYRHHGFIPLLTQPRTLFLPVATAGQALHQKR